MAIPPTTASIVAVSATSVSAAIIAGSASTISTVIVPIPAATAPIPTIIAPVSTTTRATGIPSAANLAPTGARSLNGDAIGYDGSVAGGREDQHVRTAAATDFEVIELGSAIAIGDSRGGSRQNAATGRDRCRHGDAARSKVVTVGVLYLDCRLAVESDAGCS